MARDEAYRIAEAKIEEACRSGTENLDLSILRGDTKSPKLNELPESLGRLAQLKTLDLSRNQLTTLPKSLSRLTQLRTLDLSRNRLTTLPKSLSRLTQLRTLDLSHNRLTTLAEPLGRLTQLRTLDLSRNRLTTLAEPLGRLTQLRTLNLSDNKLTILPEWLGRLAHLEDLDLGFNRLPALPEWLGRFTRLKTLRVLSNELTTLPESLGRLTRLRELHLGANGLRILPECLGRLAHLESLRSWHNQLTMFPEWLGRLTQLDTLDLSGNLITTLPEWLGQFTQLQWLDLSDNQIRTLPESLGQLARLRLANFTNNRLASLPESLRGLANLKELCLHGNPDLGLPDEVLGPMWADSGPDKSPKPPREILGYYFSTRGQAGEALGELRLIVVGPPKVGKTSLIKRLRGLPMDTNEVETHGIDILPLDLPCEDRLLRARVWDFGGQHVLHAMHEFFLRRRCLYLLAVEQRVNDVERDLTYWLQLIRSYGGDAPVVVALNQSKGVARSLARASLERDYAPIFAWVPTECEAEEKVPGANATIRALRQALTKAADQMEGPRRLFPVKWRQIKTWLEEMKEPYLDYSAYAKYCTKLHVDDPEEQQLLAAAMDELGIAFNYARDPRLHDTTVLRPNWLANGIYALLRGNILTANPIAPDGVLTIEKVGEILAVAEKAGVLQAAEYPPEKRPFLLRLMNLFQLSYPLDEEGGRHLVPTLLSADEPGESEEPDGADVVKLRYEFDVVPGPLIGRFLVRLFSLIDGRKAWQRGVRLRYGAARARVWADLSETYVYATVAGGERDRAELLEMIRETLKEMFREYERLRVVEQWWHHGDWVPRGTLEKFGVLPREEQDEDAQSARKEVTR